MSFLLARDLKSAGKSADQRRGKRRLRRRLTRAAEAVASLSPWALSRTSSSHNNLLKPPPQA
eukprot:scaffold75527_cov31-Phaeocystis_antarctica.AAC.1